MKTTTGVGFVSTFLYVTITAPFRKVRVRLMTLCFLGRALTTRLLGLLPSFVGGVCFLFSVQPCSSINMCEHKGLADAEVCTTPGACLYVRLRVTSVISYRATEGQKTLKATAIIRSFEHYF